MKYFFQKIILIYSLLLCYKSQDNPEDDLEISDSNEKEKETLNEELNDSLINSGNVSNESDPFANMQNIEIESIEFGEPIELSDHEMDTILLCAYIAQYALKNKYQDDLKKIAEKIGEENVKKVYDKIGSEFTGYCISDIKNETINKYITNLNYHNNFEWEDGFDSYTQIDYDKYNTKADLKYTIEEHVLLKLLRQSNQEFERRKREKVNAKEPEKPKREVISNKNVNNQKSILQKSIWNEIKFFLGAILILFIFLRLVKLLKKTNSEKKEHNSKEKKKEKKVE